MSCMLLRATGRGEVGVAQCYNAVAGGRLCWWQQRQRSFSRGRATCSARAPAVEVVHHFRVYVKKYWHVHNLTRPEPLLLETKALQWTPPQSMMGTEARRAGGWVGPQEDGQTHCIAADTLPAALLHQRAYMHMHLACMQSPRLAWILLK